MVRPFKFGSRGSFAESRRSRTHSMAAVIFCTVLLSVWPLLGASAEDNSGASPSSSDAWQQVDESNGKVLELPQVYGGDNPASSADDNQDQNAENTTPPPDADNAQAQADSSSADNAGAPDQIGSIDDYQNQQIYGPTAVYIPIQPNYGPLYPRPGYPSGWYQAPPIVPRMPAMAPGFHGIPPGNSVMPAPGGMTSIMPVRPMMMPARPMMPGRAFSPINRSFGAGGGMFRR